MTPTRFRRIVRLSLFVACLLALIYLGGSTALAWAFAYSLTHPACDPTPPRLAETVSPEEQWLTTSDGISIRVWYYPSQNGSVILATGGMDGALGSHLPPVGFLLKRGYGVLQFDSRACAKPSSPVTLGGKEVLDVSAGLDFLKSHPEVKRIGAYGFSMGAATAVRSATLHPELAALVAEGGFFNLGDNFVEPGSRQSILRKLFRYSIAGAYWLQSGVNPWQISPIDDLHRLSPRPLLLIFGEKEASGAHASAQLSAAGEPKTLWVVPGGDHGKNYAAAPDEYERHILNFFDQYLVDR